MFAFIPAAISASMSALTVLVAGLAFVTAPMPAVAADAPTPCPALLRHSAARLQDDAPQDLCQYRSKVLLVVNTASFCGFTPQYEGLQKLHETYQARGFEVLGFPSNDFFQESVSNKKIADFCEATFGIRFPMFASGAVKGDKAQPFYQALARAAGGEEPRWNFHKYLTTTRLSLLRTTATSCQNYISELKTLNLEVLPRSRYYVSARFS